MSDRFVKVAFELAERYHAGQLYGSMPYVCHLDSVLHVVKSTGCQHASVLMAAVLHDSLEDGKTDKGKLTSDDLRFDMIKRLGQEECEQFDIVEVEECVRIVNAVTGVGHNRKTRNASIYDKVKWEPKAAIVKIADRIANVESCWTCRDGKLFMYRREHDDFRAAMMMAITNDKTTLDVKDMSLIISMVKDLDDLIKWEPKFRLEV